MIRGATHAAETSSPAHADAPSMPPHIQQYKQGMHYGSGTTSTLAINTFQQRVKRNRTRDWRSERSIVSISRQNSSRNANAFVPVASARLSDAYQSGDVVHSQPLSFPPPLLRASTLPVAMGLV